LEIYLDHKEVTKWQKKGHWSLILELIEAD